MTLKLYELVGAEDRRSSPFCWSCRLALAHKGLEPELIGVRYTDKKAIAFSGQDKVPILVDGDNVVPDSFQIACYLERAYPDAPALFGGAIGCAEARFVNEWVNTAVHPRLSPLIIRDAYDWVHEDDRKYFRETRTKWLRKNFDELQADRDAKVLEFRETLAPARATLGHQAFLCGSAPAYADYILFGAFQFARVVSPFKLLQADDPVFGWRQRMLERFDGLAQRAKGYPV